MAKKPEDYLITEAKRIGFKRMMQDMEQLLKNDLSTPQKVALTDQKNKIDKLLNEL
jgi:hypothetical protein